MAIVTTSDEHYKNIANAIREKSGSSDLLKPEQMADAITGIKSGVDDSVIDAILTGDDRSGITPIEITYYGNSLRAYCLRGVVLSKLSIPNVANIYGSAVEEFYSDDVYGTYGLELYAPKAEVFGGQSFYYRNFSGDVVLPKGVDFGSYSFSCARGKKIIIGSSDSLITFRGSSFRNAMFEIVDICSPAVFFSDYCMSVDVNSCKGVILRYPQMSALRGSTMLPKDDVISGTDFHIYVPSALFDEYKSATNYCNFSDGVIRRIEDYPDICG